MEKDRYTDNTMIHQELQHRRMTAGHQIKGAGSVSGPTLDQVLGIQTAAMDELLKHLMGLNEALVPVSIKVPRADQASPGVEAPSYSVSPMTEKAQDVVAQINSALAIVRSIREDLNIN